MRIAVKIVLSDEDRLQLERNVSSKKTAVRLVERSRIILLANEGKDNQIIARELKITTNTVSRWRNRFADEGLKALLKDRPRGGNWGGKDAVKQAKLRDRIIKITTQRKPDNATHWSARTLAKELNTKHSFVHRVWQSVGLKPHLEKTFKVSNDKHFEEKLRDVVGLYLTPPENAVVFCVDEKTSIQALDRTQPGLPLKKGRCSTVTHDYKRNGTSTLFAALEVATGQVLGKCYQKHTHKEFLSFLKQVNRQVEDGQELHVIVDNYATHKHEKVKNWLKRNKRVVLHFTPTSSSWLNLVERFFGTLTQKHLKRGIYTSVKELEKSILQYIDGHNDSPKPFVWTKTTEVILEKVARARATLNKVNAI